MESYIRFYTANDIYKFDVEVPKMVMSGEAYNVLKFSDYLGPSIDRVR